MAEIAKIMQLSNGKLHRMSERIRNNLTSIIKLFNLKKI